MPKSRHVSLLSAVSLLALAAPVTADGPAELVLSPGFRIEASRDLPAPARVPGLRLEPRRYDDFSATEWQAVLRGSPGPPAVLYEDVASADFVVAFPGDGEAGLHWSRGSHAEPADFRLLDLGNPEARAWAVETVSRQIRDAGVSIYRQDFNLYPAFNRPSSGTPARGPEVVGLREVRYVNGLYRFLDELARRHPGLILDNCASGGRRLDFEMTRRCVCLWRSDSCWDDKAAAPATCRR